MAHAFPLRLERSPDEEAPTKQPLAAGGSRRFEVRSRGAFTRCTAIEAQLPKYLRAKTGINRCVA